MIEKSYDLDKAQGHSENRNAVLFLLGFLGFCFGVALWDFAFYTWTIELACGVVYVAIFMFAFSTKDYTPGSTSLFWGTAFLFTFVFEAVYFFLIAHSGAPDFRLAPVGSFFWVCTQWFQAASFVIVVNRNRPFMGLPNVLWSFGLISVGLVSFATFFPELVTLITIQYGVLYLGANVVGISLLYGYGAWELMMRWQEQPRYFAARLLLSAGFSVLACVGLALSVGQGPVMVFFFSYLRFVAVALCYNANVIFTLHSPYRALTGTNKQLEDTLKLLHETQDKLVEAAKLSAAGQLIAGISHDLNTPLAAIQSSSRMLRSLIQDQMLGIHNSWDALDEGQREFFSKALTELVASDGFLDSRSEREARQHLASLAADSGKAQATDLAHMMVQVGLGHRQALFEEILTLDEPMPVVRALEPLATIHQLSTVIHQAADRASNVVRALQTFLRTGSEGDQQLVDVQTSVQSILPLFQPQVRRGLKLTTHLEEAWVRAWPEKLTQVWVNLITNAVQAAGPQGRVGVIMRTTGQTLEVAVENDGPEVPIPIRERIFDMFFTTKLAGEGTGLGLYVCRRIIEELGGELTLNSQPTLTVFTARLPLDPDLL